MIITTDFSAFVVAKPNQPPNSNRKYCVDNEIASDTFRRLAGVCYVSPKIYPINSVNLIFSYNNSILVFYYDLLSSFVFFFFSPSSSYVWFRSLCSSFSLVLCFFFLAGIFFVRSFNLLMLLRRYDTLGIWRALYLQ